MRSFLRFLYNLQYIFLLRIKVQPGAIKAIIVIFPLSSGISTDPDRIDADSYLDLHGMFRCGMCCGTFKSSPDSQCIRGIRHFRLRCPGCLMCRDLILHFKIDQRIPPPASFLAVFVEYFVEP